nr:hypothetical protein [Tanacetum cinerariifolium]
MLYKQHIYYLGDLLYQQIALKNRNLNINVNAAKANSVNVAKGNKVTSAVGNQGINVVKSSACWVWRPKIKVQDHVSKNSGSYICKRFEYGAPQDALKDQGYFDSGCSMHMTGNISYLTNFKEHDGGYVTFEGGAKGGKITGKGTIITDSKLPTTFYAEAVSTACYVQYRVLVVKPHFKTPYELFKGRSPALNFMRPFGCHVSILNTLDQLGKFDGKSDEEIFVGYSTTSGGPEWLFNLDALSKSMNYAPVSAGTNSNDFAGKGASFDAALDSHNKDKHGPFQASESDNHERPNAESSTKTVNTAGPVNTATPTYVDYPNDPLMPDLKDARIFDDAYDDRDEGAKADYNNLETALDDESWVEAIQEEFLQFKLLNVWTLVDLPPGKIAIGTKWVYRNKRDQRGIVVRNKARLVAQGHRQEEGINYDEVFAPVTRIEEISLFLAYASFMDFTVYQMDVKSAFLYDNIKEETKIHMDNESAICVVKNHVYHLKTYHIEIRHHFIRDSYEKRLVEMVKIHTDYNVTDLLTKAFNVTRMGCKSGQVMKIGLELKWYLINDGYADLVQHAGDYFNTADVFLLGFHQHNKWSSIHHTSAKVNDDVRIQALVDGKRVNIKESSIKRILRLDDAEGTGFSKEVTILFDNMLVQAPKEVGILQADAQPIPIPTEPLTSKPQKKHKPKRKHTKEPKVPPTESQAEHNVPLPLPSHDPRPSDLESEVINIKSTYKARIEKLESREESSKQKRKIADIDVEINLEKFQAEAYNLDLDHQEKVLSMLDVNDEEPVDVKEVLEVVKAVKLITEVVTTAGVDVNAFSVKDTLITTAEATKVIVEVPKPRKRRGVIIQDPEETTTTIVTVQLKVQAKDKGKAILIEEPKPLKRQVQIDLDEEVARQVEAELNTDINWNAVIEQVKRSERLTYAVMKYQALKRKPLTEAQAKRNMIVYLKSMAGYKMNYFKGMSYDEIRPIFEKHYNYNQAFLNEIVPDDDDDDVYGDATPLALKIPIVDYKIYTEKNRPYFKIIRADGNHRERFEKTEPKNYTDDYLLNTLKIMFEKPNVEANVWKDQKGKYGLENVKSWKLFDSYRVYCLNLSTTQIFLLVEKMYHLTHFTLEQMVNDVRLEVDDESEMSLELLRLVRRQLNEGYVPQ